MYFRCFGRVQALRVSFLPSQRLIAALCVDFRVLVVLVSVADLEAQTLRPPQTDKSLFIYPAHNLGYARLAAARPPVWYYLLCPLATPQR